MGLEFYFIRHGQTDYNLNRIKEDHPSDISLNSTGREQAKAIEPLIASLPIKTICCSPFRRAQETKELITPRLSAPHQEIEQLGECTGLIWRELLACSLDRSTPLGNATQSFLTCVKTGLNLALSYEGPVLIVAHGGVHLALCLLLAIEDHPWVIDNCIPVHVYQTMDSVWKATELYHTQGESKIGTRTA